MTTNLAPDDYLFRIEEDGNKDDYTYKYTYGGSYKGKFTIKNATNSKDYTLSLTGDIAAELFMANKGM